MTWYAAKDRCKAKGGKLVEIDSEEENTFLVLEINRKGYDNDNNTADNNNNNDNNKHPICLYSIPTGCQPQAISHKTLYKVIPNNAGTIMKRGSMINI